MLILFNVQFSVRNTMRSTKPCNCFKKGVFSIYVSSTGQMSHIATIPGGTCLIKKWLFNADVNKLILICKKILWMLYLLTQNSYFSDYIFDYIQFYYNFNKNYDSFVSQMTFLTSNSCISCQITFNSSWWCHIYTENF